MIILFVFSMDIAIAPAWGQGTDSFILTGPDKVDKGDNFSLNIKPSNPPLDQKDVVLEVPAGFSLISAMPLADGSITYYIHASQIESFYTLSVTITQNGKAAQTLSRNIYVQKSFFETAQPYIFWGSIILIVGAIVGGMSSSSSGSRGGFMY